jgi:hypothetical protein
MSKCPKCGCELFYRSIPARGHWEEVIKISDEGEIDVVESFTDSIICGRAPKTVKCADCQFSVEIKTLVPISGH